jgi:hypothetical protein
MLRAKAARTAFAAKGMTSSFDDPTRAIVAAPAPPFKYVKRA